MKDIVVDASVALKWFLSDEEDGDKALAILERHVSNRLNILAPSLLEYEMLNGLVVARRRARVREEDVLNALDGFMNLDIEFITVYPLYKKVLELCKSYSLTAYDGGYLAVAEDKGVPFVTADKRLFNSAKKSKWVKWIGDVRFPTR